MKISQGKNPINISRDGVVDKVTTQLLCMKRADSDLLKIAAGLKDGLTHG